MVSLTPNLHDDLLIRIDYLIFGFNPTVELNNIANRYLTEFLQIIYISFYILPVIYALELFLWHRYNEMKFATFVIFLGFYLSFIGYLILPAVGPRFTLHNFYNINDELPGVFLTNIMRDIINFGESIPKNVLNASAIAQRDAFPSGHTIIILLIVYLSRKTKSKSFYFYFPYSILMIFSTIYLRYHYVVDIFGGILISIITVFAAGLIYKDKEVFSKKLKKS